MLNRRAPITRRSPLDRTGRLPARRATPIDRFWAAVRRGANDECWEWLGAKRGGYGCFRVDGAVVQAHRFSHEIHVGPIPAGMVVRHRCDNPPCCNPAHIVLGTQRDNVHDMFERRRAVILRGEKNGSSKLTADQVRAIWSSTRKYNDLASDFGVTVRVIGLIKRGQMWTSVTGGPSSAPRAKATIGWSLASSVAAEIVRLASSTPQPTVSSISRLTGVSRPTVRRAIAKSQAQLAITAAAWAAHTAGAAGFEVA